MDQPHDIPSSIPAGPPPGDQPRPLIGITMGDPGGIGAEVVVKALADPEVRRRGRFIVYGLAESLAYAADLAEVNPFWFRMPHENVGRIESGVIAADFDEFPVFAPAVRYPTADGGVASMRFLEAAIEAARHGRIDALVTAPICKASWRLAGYKYPGHTERLGEAFNTNRVTMMFLGGRLRIALASIHEPLFELRNSFTIGKVFQPIELMDAALRDWFGIENPRIAVCGLNPHASEEGLFGDEETRIIEPAMVMAREAGANVAGPFPADTIFWRAMQGHFDGIVAMYHDQGLIPIKLLAFDEAVQMTLGLPIIRISVDHGTAFDIAGQNRANPASMKAAIRLACDLAIRRRSPGNGASSPRSEASDVPESSALPADS